MFGKAGTATKWSGCSRPWEIVEQTKNHARPEPADFHPKPHTATEIAHHGKLRRRKTGLRALTKTAQHLRFRVLYELGLQLSQRAPTLADDCMLIRLSARGHLKSEITCIMTDAVNSEAASVCAVAA